MIGDQLRAHGADVQLLPAIGRPEHTPQHPRINVVGRHGTATGPAIHLNGHFDVVPAGLGWTRDPFGGEIADGRLYGRGSCDMKAGLAAAVFAVEAIRRAGVKNAAPIESERHGRRRERRFCRRRVARGKPPPLARADQGGDHSRAVRRRSRLRRSSRRLLVRGDRAGPNRARQHAVSRHQRDRGHVAPARPGPRRARPGALRPRHDDAGGARGLAARHHQHQRHRRRTAGGRHAESRAWRIAAGWCSIAGS